jgi:hypothetical protein
MSSVLTGLPILRYAASRNSPRSRSEIPGPVGDADSDPEPSSPNFLKAKHVTAVPNLSPSNCSPLGKYSLLKLLLLVKPEFHCIDHDVLDECQDAFDVELIENQVPQFGRSSSTMVSRTSDTLIAFCRFELARESAPLVESLAPHCQ